MGPTAKKNTVTSFRKWQGPGGGDHREGKGPSMGRKTTSKGAEEKRTRPANRVRRGRLPRRKDWVFLGGGGGDSRRRLQSQKRPKGTI